MTKDYAIELYCTGKKDAAHKIFKNLIDSGFKDADIYCHYALIEEEKGNFAEAIFNYEKALELNPNLIPALANLGTQLKNMGEFSTALTLLRKSCELAPNNSLILSNYANTLTAIAEHEEAVKFYLEALKLMPNNYVAFSGYLLSLNYHDKFSAEEIFQSHLKFSNAIGEIQTTLPPYRHDKLRIGYLSADFKRHSVTFFIEGILHFHNRQKFSIYCYSDVTKPDLITEKISRMDLIFTDVKNLSDKQLYDKIRQDEIDILIDLSGHTGKRLNIFANRAAPLQINYLGYCNTTGLKNIDWRLVDKITDLPNSLAAEKLFRLQRPFLAFCPPENSIPLKNSPCLQNGYITFGSFNNLPKITDEVIRLWIRLLKKVENSKLIIKSKAFKDKNFAAKFIAKFTSRDIAAERIILREFQATLDDHLSQYQELDIALDTFPYNGTTTTCEALFMGLPVITLSGTTHAARVSESILTYSGLNFLVAKNKNDYLDIAAEVAADYNKLNEFHLSLRQLFLASPVCDSLQLTQDIENFFLTHSTI